MRLLWDMHTFSWFVAGSDQINSKVRQTIENSSNKHFIKCFVKQRRYEKDKMFLYPENKGYRIYEVKGMDTFQIVGVAIAVCSKFDCKR